MAIEEIAAGDMDSVLHTNRGGLVLLVVCGWISLLFLVSFLGNVGPVSSTGADVAAPAAPSAMTLPTECLMPSDMMVSGNNCSYNDEQSMDGLMGGCREFLTNTENAPTQDCCFGINQVAYAHTPCYCKATFYLFCCLFHLQSICPFWYNLPHVVVVCLLPPVIGNLSNTSVAEHRKGC